MRFNPFRSGASRVSVDGAREPGAGVQQGGTYAAVTPKAAKASSSHVDKLIGKARRAVSHLTRPRSAKVKGPKSTLADLRVSTSPGGGALAPAVAMPAPRSTEGLYPKAFVARHLQLLDMPAPWMKGDEARLYRDVMQASAGLRTPATREDALDKLTPMVPQFQALIRRSLRQRDGDCAAMLFTRVAVPYYIARDAVGKPGAGPHQASAATPAVVATKPLDLALQQQKKLLRSCVSEQSQAFLALADAALKHASDGGLDSLKTYDRKLEKLRSHGLPVPALLDLLETRCSLEQDEARSARLRSEMERIEAGAGGASLNDVLRRADVTALDGPTMAKQFAPFAEHLCKVVESLLAKPSPNDGLVLAGSIAPMFGQEDLRPQGAAMWKQVQRRLPEINDPSIRSTVQAGFAPLREAMGEPREALDDYMSSLSALKNRAAFQLAENQGLALAARLQGEEGGQSLNRFHGALAVAKAEDPFAAQYHLAQMVGNTDAPEILCEALDRAAHIELLNGNPDLGLRLHGCASKYREAKNCPRTEGFGTRTDTVLTAAVTRVGMDRFATLTSDPRYGAAWGDDIVSQWKQAFSSQSSA